MKLKQIGLAWGIAGLGLVGSVTSAQAAQLIGFSFSGTGINASGTFTTTDLNPTTNSYTITGISGTFNGQPFTGIVPTSAGVPDITPGVYDYPNSTSPYFFYNNILFNSSPIFDGNGVLFTVGSVAAPDNIFYDGNYEYLSGQYLSDRSTPTVPLTLNVTTATPVPEPNSALGTAVVGLFLGLSSLKKRFASKLMKRPTVAC